jgi:hypothetical protein
MRCRSKLLGGLSAICLVLAALAGCGGGSSDPQSSISGAERQAAPAATVGAVAEWKEKGQKKPVGGSPEHSTADHRSASRRTEGSRPAPFHHKQPTDHNPAAVVKEVVAGGGGGNIERTASSPDEIREIIEESESSSGTGSSSNPVQSVLEAIGR